MSPPGPRSLLDLLACPACRSGLTALTQETLSCGRCGKRYPIVNGTPILLDDPQRATVSHEGELGVRPGYSAWKERVILRSLTDAQVVLDFGAGRQALDDPCIVRMDLVLHPYVDVVGDIHRLPFQEGAFDFAFGGAVIEHLARPWDAARELHRVLKPGGYIYADCSFVFAYHGYPHHYFNATIHGIRELFSDFTEIERGVTPFHGSAFALRSVLETYLEVFRQEKAIDREFAALLHRILWHPLEDFDSRIPSGDRFRVAAGVYFLGIKQPQGGEHVIPEPIMAVYEKSPALRERFPRVLDLSVPENLMLWARSRGRLEEPAVAAVFDGLVPFNKRANGAPWDRSALEALPPFLMVRADPLPDAHVKEVQCYFSRRLRDRLREGWHEAGARGVARALALALLRTWHERVRPPRV